VAHLHGVNGNLALFYVNIAKFLEVAASCSFFLCAIFKLNVSHNAAQAKELTKNCKEK